MRAIPDNNLAYAVLITLASGGQGSGFFLNAPPSGYLVTAAHVLYDEKGALRSDVLTVRAFPADPDDPGWVEYRVHLTEVAKASNLLKHASQDIVALRLFKLAQLPNDSGLFVTMQPGVITRSTTTGGQVGVGVGSLKRFKDVPRAPAHW